MLEVFECRSKACAPPPVGVGGSKGGNSKAKADYSNGYKAGTNGGSWDALGRADDRGVSEHWYTGFHDAAAGHPKFHSMTQESSG